MYEVKKEQGIFRSYGKDEEQLTNFTAEITKQTRIHDDKNCETILTIVGHMNGKDLPEIQVPASDFASLGWVAKHWGVEPVILPVSNAERDVRTAMQFTSKPKTIDVYKHTGWAKVKKKHVYLHAGGAIHDKGNDAQVTVSLPPDLAKYRFEPMDCDPKESFRASMSLNTVAPPSIMWPLLAAAYRSAMGPADFAVHLSGRTGTYKTECCSLVQSHFGSAMDSRNMPASWSSTANALEALAYNAKNAIITVDDFVPNGTAWQVRALQKTADQLIRGQGNQAGRARMTDRSAMQTTYYPRGIVLSTGEDVPDGHSIRARMMILEMSPGDVDLDKLTIAQKQRAHLQNAMFHWIKWLAYDPRERLRMMKEQSNIIRDGNRDIGHSRTPGMIGDLLATINMLLIYAENANFITRDEHKRLDDSAYASIMEQAKEQEKYLQESDPADAFQEVLQQLLASHLAHLRTREGTTPENADRCGWIRQSGDGQIANWKSHGPQLGWTDWAANELLVDVNALPFMKRHAGGRLSMTRQTLLKRLKDGQHLARTDQERQRNTVRVTCEGHQRTVICLSLDRVISTGEENDTPREPASAK